MAHTVRNTHLKELPPGYIQPKTKQTNKQKYANIQTIYQRGNFNKAFRYAPNKNNSKEKQNFCHYK